MKYLFCMLIFLSAQTVWAQKIVLDREFTSGSRLVDIIKKEKGEYFVQGKKMGNKLPVAVQTAWNQIQKHKSSNPLAKNCSAGAYRLVVTGAKKSKKVIQGCAQGKEYARLASQFQTLRDYSKTVK